MVVVCELEISSLDQEVSDRHFYDISRYLSEWRLIAPQLNITEPELKAIERNYPTEEERRDGFLKKWKQKESFRATYKVVVNALLGIDRAEDARNVCQLLKHTKKEMNISDNSLTSSTAQPSPHSPPSTEPTLLSSSNSQSSSLPSHHVPGASFLDIEQEIERMKQAFEDLVDATEDSILEKKIPLRQLQRSIKHIPASLKLPLGEYFRDLTASIFLAKSVEQVISLLSDCWDYLNPGLLTFFVGRFGSPDNIASMNAYLTKLGEFRTRVKLGDYLRIQQHHDPIGRDCNEFIFKKLVMVMKEDVWEKKTLQDVENFKIELANECRLQPFLPKIYARVHSIALVFIFPCWIQLDLKALESFFADHYVLQVYLNNLLEFDGTVEKHLKQKPSVTAQQLSLGSQCVAIVESALDHIRNDATQNASATLCELEKDSSHLVAEAAELIRKLEMIEDHHIHEGERIQREIDNLVCQEEALRQQKNSEEAKLVSNRSVLWDNESRLRSAESDVESAERKLEKAKEAARLEAEQKNSDQTYLQGILQDSESRLRSAEKEVQNAESKLKKAKEDEEKSLKIGANVGAIVWLPLFIVGGLAGAAAGASIAAVVNAHSEEVTTAQAKLERCKDDYQRARLAVEESERRVTSIRPQLTTLEERINKVKLEHLSYHEKAGEIMKAIVFWKSSLEFWELFKQAAEHEEQSLLHNIVEKAYERGNYRALTSRNQNKEQVAVYETQDMTFLEAWETNHLAIKEKSPELPHIILYRID